MNDFYVICCFDVVRENYSIVNNIEMHILYLSSSSYVLCKFAKPILVY